VYFGFVAKKRRCYEAGQLQYVQVVSKVLLRLAVYGEGTEHNIDGMDGDGKKLAVGDGWGWITKCTEAGGMDVKGARRGGDGAEIPSPWRPLVRGRD